MSFNSIFAGTNQSNNAPSLGELREMLSHIDCSDRETWFKVTLAVSRAYNASEQAYTIVKDWASQFSGRSAEDERHERNEYFHTALTTDGVGIGYVVNLAKQGGYVYEKHSNVLEHEGSNSAKVNFDAPFIVRKQDADSERQKRIIDDMGIMGATALSYLMITADNDERMIILSQISDFGRYFVEEQGKIFNLLCDYCSTHKLFDYDEFQQYVVFKKAVTEDELFYVLKSAKTCKSFETCLSYLKDMKTAYNTQWAAYFSEKLTHLYQLNALQEANNILEQLFYKMLGNDGYQIFGPAEVERLSLKDIMEKTDPELNNAKFIPSDWAEIREAINGWAVHEFSIIAGHSGVGKTQKLIDEAARVAESGYPVLICTGEMTAQAIAGRLFEQTSQVSQFDYSNANLIKERYLVYESCLKTYSNFYIMQTDSAMSIEHIESAVAQWCSMIGKDKVGFVGIDYLQLIVNNTGGGRIPMYERIRNTSLRIKQLAKRHNVAVLLLAQLNNPNQAGRSDSKEIGVYKAPNQFDMAGCTQAVQDAAAMIAMYKVDSVNFPDDQPSSTISIGKIGPKIETSDLGNHEVIRMDVLKSRYTRGSGKSFDMYRSRGGGFWSKRTSGLLWGIKNNA